MRQPRLRGSPQTWIVGNACDFGSRRIGVLLAHHVNRPERHLLVGKGAAHLQDVRLLSLDAAGESDAGPLKMQMPRGPLPPTPKDAKCLPGESLQGGDCGNAADAHLHRLWDLLSLPVGHAVASPDPVGALRGLQPRPLLQALLATEHLPRSHPLLLVEITPREHLGCKTTPPPPHPSSGTRGSPCDALVFPASTPSSCLAPTRSSFPACVHPHAHPRTG